MPAIELATKLADGVFDGWGANVCSPTDVMENAEVLTETLTLIVSQSLLVEVAKIDHVKWLVTLSALQDFVYDVRSVIPEPAEMIGYLFVDDEDLRQFLSALTENAMENAI